MPLTATSPASATTSAPPLANGLAWFADMVRHCQAYALAEHAAGRPIVGIMCEYTPRELIMAAGAIPVCLCGGDADTIPAAEAELPAGLCPLIKSTYGYLVERSNPFLEMADLVIAETTCDGKKKMFELMGEARATYLMALPPRQDDPAALESWVIELRRLKEFLEARYGVEISADRLRAAIAVMNRERAARRRLAECMKADDPPFSGRQLLDLKCLISGIPVALEQLERAFPLCDAVPARRSDEVAARLPAAGRPVRVLLTGVPLVHGAERVMDLIEQHGGLVVCQENCTGLKPLLEDVDANADDPLRALAIKYDHLPCSVKTPNTRRIEALRGLAADYRAECVVELIWQGCLTYAVESARVRRFAERDLGVPYLRIETDYSPADSARIAVRLEALFETVRGRATPPPACHRPDATGLPSPGESRLSLP